MAFVRLTIVVPCYNEEQVISETIQRLSVIMVDLIRKEKIDPFSRILYVNDGSVEHMWERIKEFYKTDPFVAGINLVGNTGYQNALIVGLTVAKDLAFDLTISIDADLQDDVNAIYEMIDEYQKGNDIVYGVRSSRTTDSFFKRNTANLFYKLMLRLGIRTVYNHADYRLMSQRAIVLLCSYKENNLFLRGIVPLIGYTSSKVFYERHERFVGNFKYFFEKSA